MGKKKHVANVLFTVLLLGVFALSAIFVSLLGAEVYQSSAAKMQANFDTRTSLVYIAEKLRQSASSDFSVREIEGGGSALVVTERYDNRKTYETWIYAWKGKLREATVEAGADISAGGGQEIMDMKSMSFEMDGKLVRITSINSAGERKSLAIGRRGGS
ncbi:MAG: DUF4860 domain-containing protein [Clostridiales Family XIII bacterium]|jgi:hypothetical protein|nr:DUF4860 domain-containing protein [Clostridiales Family XIII bacterium]